MTSGKLLPNRRKLVVDDWTLTGDKKFDELICSYLTEGWRTGVVEFPPQIWLGDRYDFQVYIDFMGDAAAVSYGFDICPIIKDHLEACAEMDGGLSPKEVAGFMRIRSRLAKVVALIDKTLKANGK